MLSSTSTSSLGTTLSHASITTRNPPPKPLLEREIARNQDEFRIAPVKDLDMPNRERIRSEDPETLLPPEAPLTSFRSMQSSGEDGLLVLKNTQGAAPGDHVHGRERTKTANGQASRSSIQQHKMTNNLKKMKLKCKENSFNSEKAAQKMDFRLKHPRSGSLLRPGTPDPTSPDTNAVSTDPNASIQTLPDTNDSSGSKRGVEGADVPIQTGTEVALLISQCRSQIKKLVQNKQVKLVAGGRAEDYECQVGRGVRDVD
uniref:WH2 domain-containing protein n=1 Tax=Caenorhabditis tropicalis TaxID=1561998 RepID=A0A1I7UPR6_9PELO